MQTLNNVYGDYTKLPNYEKARKLRYVISVGSYTRRLGTRSQSYGQTLNASLPTCLTVKTTALYPS